jgi:iron complex outermembrane receptor protein
MFNKGGRGMNVTLKFKTILATGVAAAALATGAWAQDGSAEVGEVVVTAQKRSERLLDVPMSVSATSGEQLTAAGISSTGDLQQVTPGLVTVNNGLAFTPAIRGISSVGTSPGDETNVAVYLDDVYLGAPLAGLFDLKDIERVEVLKGPQGTLFGRNATGGAIRIVTKAPSFDSSVEVSADYGFKFDRVKIGAYVTGPITDQVAGSLNLFYLNDDGYVKGVGPRAAGKRYAKADNYAIRGKLLFKPSETFQATLAADYSYRNDNSVFILVPQNGMNVNRSNPAAVIARPFEYSGGTEPIVKVESYSASLDAVWEASEDVTVRSISAYRQAKGLYQPDADRTNLALSGLRLPQRQETLSQEFNVSGPTDARWSWLLGGYLYYSDAGNPYFNSYVGDAPTGTIVASFRDTVRTHSYAAFADLTFNATEQLHFTAGARYTTESKRMKFRDLIRAAGLRTATDNTTWKSPTFRGVVRYDIAPDFNVYASVSNGFKSGVYNAYALPPIPVEPEKITAVEIGAKGRFNGITVTAAAFGYAYKNIQVQGQTLLGQAWVVTLANAARAKIRGYEISANGPLGDHLSFDIGYSGLPRAKYTEFTQAQVFIPNATGGATNVVPFDASGSRVIRSPKHQVNARLTYTNEIADGDFAATVAYTYNDGFYWQPANLSKQGAYGVVNARVSWTDPNDQVTYSVWAENLTDVLYSINTSSGGVGISDAYAAPRLIGVGITAKF